MKYETSGEGEGLDPLAVQMMIECFNESGESGPHSTEGWALSHILNHCHANDVPFTLAFLPKKGFYLKRDIVAGVVPPEIQHSFDYLPLSGL